MSEPGGTGQSLSCDARCGQFLAVFGSLPVEQASGPVVRVVKQIQGREGIQLSAHWRLSWSGVQGQGKQWEASGAVVGAHQGWVSGGERSHSGVVGQPGSSSGSSCVETRCPCWSDQSELPSFDRPERTGWCWRPSSSWVGHHPCHWSCIPWSGTRRSGGCARRAVYSARRQLHASASPSKCR
jgi:hypothetical protein